MKTCTTCNISKDVTEFNFKNKVKGTRQSQCRKCLYQKEKLRWQNKNDNRRRNHVDKTAQRRNRNRAFVWQYLMEHPCVTCGESDPIVLDFDHLDTQTKYKAISDMIRGQYSIQKISHEISKCRVLCSNCHRRHTHKQFDYWTPYS